MKESTEQRDNLWIERKYLLTENLKGHIHTQLCVTQAIAKMNNLILKMGKGPKYTFLKIRCRNVKTGI